MYLLLFACTAASTVESPPPTPPVTTPTPAPTPTQPTPTTETLAIPEGSALVVLPNGDLLVAGDEDNVLFRVDAQRNVSRLSLPVRVLEGLVASKKGKVGEIDLEGMTLATLPVDGVDTPVVVLMGSHANKKVEEAKDIGDVERRPNRHVIFAIQVPGPGDTQTTLVGKPYTGLADLLQRPPPGASVALPKLDALAPNNGGLDVEGLAFAEGRLWFGLRSPVHGNTAYIASAMATVLRGEPPPTLSTLDGVNLGGGGVRSLEHTASGFLIVAGHAPVCVADGDGLEDSVPDGGFSLYTWSPPAAPVRTGEAFPAGVRAEGLAAAADALWVLSDDATSATGDPCKPKDKTSDKAKVSTLLRLPPR